ncbi:hypothetical protein EDD85DRAFT_823198 [Armillaria nabsnona]|nr:hypothetical protein EDD85DRAFT_823198 [Armillaria nabsnona]
MISPYTDRCRSSSCFSSRITRPSFLAFAVTMAPSYALLVGAKRVVSEIMLVNHSQPGSSLLNAVLSLLSPFNPDESD